MSLDDRLRDGLSRAAAGPGPDVDGTLHSVLRRYRRRARVRRSATLLATVTVVAALAVGVPTVVGELRPDQQSRTATTAAPSVTGTYVVDVAPSSTADAAGLTGRWTVVLDPTGAVVMTAPDGFRGSTSGSTYRADDHLLRVDAFISDEVCHRSQLAEAIGTYRWTRTADRLELTTVSETCDARRLLFSGQPWEALP